MPGGTEIVCAPLVNLVGILDRTDVDSGFYFFAEVPDYRASNSPPTRNVFFGRLGSWCLELRLLVWTNSR